MYTCNINGQLYSLADGYLTVDGGVVRLNGEIVKPLNAVSMPKDVTAWAIGALRLYVRNGRHSTEAA